MTWYVGAPLAPPSREPDIRQTPCCWSGTEEGTFVRSPTAFTNFVIPAASPHAKECRSIIQSRDPPAPLSRGGNWNGRESVCSVVNWPDAGVIAAVHSAIREVGPRHVISLAFTEQVIFQLLTARSRIWSAPAASASDGRTSRTAAPTAIATPTVALPRPCIAAQYRARR